MVISVSSIPQPQFPVPFLVMNFKNSALSNKDIEYLLDHIQFHGESDALLALVKSKLDASDLNQHVEVATKPVAPKIPPAPTSFS